MLRDFVVLEVDGLSIAGQLYLPDNKTGNPTVCLCHGVPAGGSPDPEDGGYPALAEQICGAGYPVFFFNFRGTGDSGGNLDILGWTRDLQAVVDYLCRHQGLNNTRLFLCGFSAGAAVSIYQAARDERVSGVAACASPADFKLFTEAEPQSVLNRFRSIGAIQDAAFPLSVSEWFDGFRQVTPVDHVAGISPRPLLLVHGSRDETVPLAHAQRLMQRAGQPKKLVIIDGGGHRLRRDHRAVSAVLDWLEAQVAGEKP